MKKKLIVSILSVILCLAMVIAFAACNKDNTEKNDTLVVGYANFSSKFSPFFYKTAYDGDVAGMTQVGLLATDRGGAPVLKGIEGETIAYNGTNYTYKGMSNIVITQNQDGTVYYDVTLREGVKFSDGVELTLNDVLFNIYVLCDPSYDGMSTFYSLPILGMTEYRTGLTTEVYNTYKAKADAIVADFTGAGYNADSTAYTQADYDSLAEAINDKDGAWKALAQDITDYVINNYFASYGGGGNKYSGKNGINAKEENQYFALGMSMWGFGSFGTDYALNEDGSAGLVGEDYKNLYTTTTDEEAAAFEDEAGTLYKAVESKDEAAFYISATVDRDNGIYAVTAYDGQRYAKVFNATFTDATGKTYDTEAGVWPTIYDYVAALKYAYDGDIVEAANTEKASGDLNSYINTVVEPWISEAGKADMNGQVVDTIAGVQVTGKNTLRIVTTEFSATTIYQLGISIAPMHYYGDASKFDLDAHKFGFDKGDLSTVRAKTTQPMGAGPYKFVEYKQGIVSFVANEYYWKGAPKIANLKFKEYNADADKAPALIAGDIDIAEPSINDAVLKTIKDANSNGQLKGNVITTSLIDNNGYGYVGMDSKRINVGGQQGSEASKNLRKGIATLLAVYREAAVNAYYGDRAMVINYPISNCSWAAPLPNDQGYAIAFSTDINGNAIYTADMSDEVKQQKALEAAIEFLKAAGYTWDAAQGKFTAAPDGAKMSYEAWIPGDGIGDHPAMAVLTGTKAALESVGIELVIKDLTNSSVLWDSLDAGTVDMWAAAWGGSNDPDMYQVYHSSDTTKSNHYHIADEDLDDLIIAARKSADTSYRKATYKQCLDIILDWAVEVPTYQRKNCTVFSTERVNIDTLTPDMTPFWGYLSEVENIELK